MGGTTVQVSVALGDEVLCQRSIDHTGTAIGEFLKWLTEMTNGAPDRVAVAIEVPRGPVLCSPGTQRDGAGDETKRQEQAGRDASRLQLATPYAMYHRARLSMQHDPCSKQHYAGLRQAGHAHGRALRGVADRLLAMLIVMLKSGQRYDQAAGVQLFLVLMQPDQKIPLALPPGGRLSPWFSSLRSCLTSTPQNRMLTNGWESTDGIFARPASTNLRHSRKWRGKPGCGLGFLKKYYFL